MFETVDGTEIHIPTIFGDDGVRAWRYVSYPLHLPWFYISYLTTSAEGDSPRQMLCLAHVDDLLSASQSEGARITEVNIVVPWHMSGQGRWTMEPLFEIWMGKEPETNDQDGYVFVTASGARYLHSGLSDHETELLDLKRIFQMPASETLG